MRALLVVLPLSVAINAQSVGPVADPYTKNEPALLAAAGYVSLGPFAWADDHVTTDIEALLGNVPLRWIETSHFKLGTTLAPFRLPASDRRGQRKVESELRRLAAKLPGVTVGTRTLDPWLRTHLFAQRLEELYADFSRRLGVTDADFPAVAGQDDGRLQPGPYLGMPQKYTVLLLEKESSMCRYLERYTGRKVRFPVNHTFGKHGSLFFGTAAEWSERSLLDDTAMHCTVAYGVVWNLLAGFRFYSHDRPLWFSCGLAQWYLRQIDPRWNCFSRTVADEPDARTEGWDWQPRVRGLVANERDWPVPEMLRSTDLAQWRFADYMVAWSRVDFLLSLGEAEFRVFVNGMSEPFHDRRREPEPYEVQRRQLDLLARAWQMDPESFEKRWRQWVLTTYRSRPLKRLPVEVDFPSK